MSSRISDAINWFEKSCFGQWMWSTDMALESTVHIENICEEKNTVLWRYENICVSSSKYTQCVFYSSWTKLLQYLRAVSIKRTIWRINILQSIVIRCSWYKPDVFLFKLCTFVRFSLSFILTRVSFFSFLCDSPFIPSPHSSSLQFMMCDASETTNIWRSQIHPGIGESKSDTSQKVWKRDREQQREKKMTREKKPNNKRCISFCRHKRDFLAIPSSFEHCIVHSLAHTHHHVYALFSSMFCTSHMLILVWKSCFKRAFSHSRLCNRKPRVKRH